MSAGPESGQAEEPVSSAEAVEEAEDTVVASREEATTETVKAV